MKREDLINAIKDLKDSNNITYAIDCLEELAINFCDNAEADFNIIRGELYPLIGYIDIVKTAYDVAEKASVELY